MNQHITPKVELSVEYAHIYTNQHITAEHELALKILGAETTTTSTSLVVMVDDYSFPDPAFDYNEFSEWLNLQGYSPDILFRESQLIPLCDEVLKLVTNRRLVEQTSDYIRTKKYPCSLFIAAWYLLRLGYLSTPLFDQKFVAKRLLNILPESFKPFENQGLELIKATQYAEATQRIEYRFFDGRLIA